MRACRYSRVHGKKLLEWQNSYDSSKVAVGGFAGYVQWMMPASAISALILFPFFGTPVVTIFFFALLCSSWIAHKSSVQKKHDPFLGLSSDDTHYLRRIACRTSWYFMDMTGKDTHWLMPDHLQEEPVSQRYNFGPGTSPTNLGIYAISPSHGSDILNSRILSPRESLFIPKTRDP